MLRRNEKVIASLRSGTSDVGTNGKLGRLSRDGVMVSVRQRRWVSNRIGLSRCVRHLRLRGDKPLFTAMSARPHRYCCLPLGVLCDLDTRRGHHTIASI